MGCSLKNRLNISLATGLALLLPAQILLVQLLSGHPQFIERWYSMGFYDFISKLLRSLTGFTYLSIGQLVLFILLTFGIIWLILRLKKQSGQKVKFLNKLKKGLLRTLASISVLYFFFMFCWGLNYFRNPIAKAVGIERTKPSKAQLIKLCESLISLTNDSRANSDELNKFEVNATVDKAIIGYQHLAKRYPELNYSHQAVKKVLLPRSMSYLGISGVYFPFSGEALINTDIPAFQLPFTICHEMAHQLGYAKEEEANFIAYLACRSNPDPTFHYAANFAALRYAMGALKKVDSTAFLNLQEHINSQVREDLNTQKAYWQQFRGPINTFQTHLNDIFLKANRQKDGVNSYGLMVELLYAEYGRNKLSY